MKIAFAGKGGSSKTTLSSLFTRHLAARGLPVVAIDADIDQHLASLSLSWTGVVSVSMRWALGKPRSPG